jgi:hypothetical protein
MVLNEGKTGFCVKRIQLTLGKVMLIAFVFVLLVGCATVSQHQSIKATDLSNIQLRVTRESVERILGRPIEVQKAKDGFTIATYFYEKERLAQATDGGGLVAELVFLPWQPIIWMVVADSLEKQKGRLTITYGQDDTVSEIDPWLKKVRNRLLRTACGDASEQYMEAYRYEHGLGVSKSLVNAYFWYGVSSEGGRHEALAMRDEIAKKMTSEELLEAERMMKNWTPPNCSDWHGGMP